MAEFKLTVSSATMHRAKSAGAAAWVGLCSIGGGWGVLRMCPVDDIEIGLLGFGVFGGLGTMFGLLSLSFPLATVISLGVAGTGYSIAKYETERARREARLSLRERHGPIE